MKNLKFKFNRLNILMLLASVLTAACSQVETAKEHTGSVVATESVPMINAKPEVVWSADAKENILIDEYNTQFKIPNQYFIKDTDEWSIEKPAIWKGVYLNMPDLKPLSNEKRRCQDKRIGTLSCFASVMEIHGGHNLNRQVFKEDGTNEINYLNYFFDKTRGETSAGIFINNPSFIKSNEYNLEAYRSIENKPIKENGRMAGDNYFSKDSFGNVQTAIRCTNSKLDKEYIGLGEFHFPTCEHRIIIKKNKMVLFITYERKYLPQWQQIQTSVESLMAQFHQAAINAQGVK